MPGLNLQKNRVNCLDLIEIFKKGENVESADRSCACQVFLQVVNAMPLNLQPSSFLKYIFFLCGLFIQSEKGKFLYIL